MVQVGSPFGYDNDVEQESSQRQRWAELVDGAVKDFVASIGQSSRQLTTSAEKFADQALRLLDQATDTVQKSASSADMAMAARQAAEEAQRAAQAILEAIEQAGERARGEALQVVQESTGRAEAAAAATDRLKQQVEQRLGEVLVQIESMLISTQAAASNALQAAQDARQIASSIDVTLPSSRDALEQAQHAAIEQAQQAAEQARQAAAEAREHASRAGQAGAADSAMSSGVQLVLERLETDYQLLTRLVQELHSRIVSFSQPAQPQQAIQPPAPQPEVTPQPAHAEPAEPSAYPPASPTQGPATSWYQMPPGAQPPVQNYERPSEPEQPPQQAAPVAAVAAGVVTISGRVLVSISPVRDFDRLLNLDGALGRLQEIRNVSLADYAKEEVTFRVELERPLSSQEFSRQLSNAVGTSIEVVSASEGDISLRLVA